MEIPIFRFALEVLIMETIKDYVAHLDNKKRRISFFRENKFFEIYEKTNNGLRLVYVSPENL